MMRLGRSNTWSEQQCLESELKAQIEKGGLQESKVSREPRKGTGSQMISTSQRQECIRSGTKRRISMSVGLSLKIESKFSLFFASTVRIVSW